MRLLIFTILILWVLSCWLQSCSTTKTLAKSDTTSLKEVDSLTKVVKSWQAKYEQISTSIIGSHVIFDTLYVPGDTVINTVTVKADGSIEASGRLKSLSVSNSSIQKQLTLIKGKYDSLAKVKSKVEVRTVTKDREVKRTVFPWWYILILGGAVFLFLKLKKIYL
jgi:hypothetical protein